MSRLRSQTGLTLVELLVAMAMAMIVFTATMGVLMSFTSDSQVVTEENNAQNQARLGIDQIVGQLRNIASPVTTPTLLQRATPYDMVFETVGTPSGANAAGTERVRYCIPQDASPGSSTTEVLIAQTQTWSGTDPGDPWSSDPAVTVACPDPNFASTILVNGVTNRYQGRTDRPAFSYNGGSAPSNLSTINTVGIDLFVNPTPAVSRAESELRSNVFLRNQQLAPVASFSATPLGGGAVLLNAGTSFSPSGDALSYSWSCSLSGSPVSCPATGAVFDWKPGAGSYTVTLTVTDPTGLQTSSQPQTVTVS